jgi:hypothetical protein
MRKIDYLAFRCSRKNLADIILKISIIYKPILSKHNELRNQVKVHVISEKFTKEK